ncbi:MAG TPA: rod shape-determining protein RodA [Armatimonadota bacterium]|jgi:rod shape determining protein RodA
MMRAGRASNFDSGLLGAVLGLLVLGLLVIFSASHVTAGASKVLRQGIWALVGLAGLLVFSRVDYRPWARYWRALLLASCVTLVATLLIAHPINGARSWINLGPMSLQPSEFTKLALIISLAGFLSRQGEKLQQLPIFLRSILYLLAPILLIMAQPDMGTAMVLCMIWLVMLWVAEARGVMILAVTGSAVLLMTVAWYLPMPNGKTLIKDYQKKRLDFLHADPAGSGYHQRQARIAIGSGELWGQGYLRGSQAQRGFLPEQETDFIYAVLGEEFGLLGCLLVLGLYLFMLFRMLRISEEAETVFGRLIVAGVGAMVAVHVVINIGMCLSLSPVTGVPLPLLSYGGSNILTTLLATGVVLNISRHRQTRRTWVVTETLVRG